MCPESVSPILVCPDSICPKPVCPEPVCPDSVCPERVCAESVYHESVCFESVSRCTPTADFLLEADMEKDKQGLIHNYSPEKVRKF